MLVCTLVLAVAVIGGATYYAANHFLTTSPSTQAKVVSCKDTGTKHLVIIKNSIMTPTHINGTLCDTLTITNDDNRLRLIAFGPHDHHTPYDGTIEKSLGQWQSVTVTLNQAGSYTFHDHLEDWLIGTFSVSN